MGWMNYEDVKEQLTGGGLLVDHLEIDTPKPVRCGVVDWEKKRDRERRGWYWLHEILLDDDGAKASYIVGAWGIWRGVDSGKVKVELRRDGKVRKLDSGQRDALNRRLREQQKRLKAMRAAEAERAAIRAAAAWRKYEAKGASPYLGRKGVEAFGLRFSPSGNGTVAVPMTDSTGKVWGLQVIRGKKGRQREKEYWPKGLSKQGHYHLIGGTPRGLVLVAEGYATAATLHQAVALPVAIAFDAGNLSPVSAALADAYPGLQVLVCADDDYRTKGNPGISKASEAALAVAGKWLAPKFAEDRPTEGPKGLTDWNDLHQMEGLHVVRAQVEGYLSGIGWMGEGGQAAPTPTSGGAGDGGGMPARLCVDDAVLRYWGTYGLGGKALFDEVERRLVHKDDVMNLLPRHGWEQLREHPGWRVARESEIGFDPLGTDEAVRCNLYGGWPTTPKPGCCELTLELLQYLCNTEANSRDIYDWLLKWLAYPIQFPGAKMHSAVVVHGPQGSGKSLVFEAVGKIYGEYGRILGQEALEDKFNADWAEKKLYILADEILAKAEMYHVKNRLKGFITGEWIRVNPKNVAAHVERNHMNIVFLSNERQPVVLENDDRRHCVVWTPPKLGESFYEEVSAELDNGGIEALHHHLLHLELGDFKPWTKPPMTTAKSDLIHLGLSSEERFIREWRSGEIDGHGDPVPFCPCMGSQLYRVYSRWCGRNGEIRPRPSNHFINFIAKQPGWRAGKSEATWNSFQDRSVKKRKMVVPSDAAMQESADLAPPDSPQSKMSRKPDELKTDWLTRGYYAFMNAMEIE